MDESGIEPETSPMLRERATDYATRPGISWKKCKAGALSTDAAAQQDSLP